MLPSPLTYGLGYQLIEAYAPAPYVLDTTPVLFDITGIDTVVTVEKFNAPQKGRIHINKQGEVFSSVANATQLNERQRFVIDFKKSMEKDELCGIGENGEILMVRMGLYAAEDMVAEDGSIIPKDGLIQVVGVRSDGASSFVMELPAGVSVYVCEISTEEHYIVSDEKYPVTLNYAGQDVPVVHLEINNGEPIENYIIRGEVEGVKTDENGAGLAGAVIGLFGADETVFTAQTALMTDISKENGAFSFKDIARGNWIVREISCPAGYVLSEESFPVVISEDKQVIRITMVNEYQRGSLKILKTFEGRETPIAGVPFTIIGKTVIGTTVIIEATTSETGEIVLDDLLVGEYRIDELASELTVDSVHNNNHISGMSEERLRNLIKKTYTYELIETEQDDDPRDDAADDTADESKTHQKIIRVTTFSPHEAMRELNFSEENIEWATIIYNTLNDNHYSP